MRAFLTVLSLRPALYGSTIVQSLREHQLQLAGAAQRGLQALPGSEERCESAKKFWIPHAGCSTDPLTEEKVEIGRCVVVLSVCV